MPLPATGTGVARMPVAVVGDIDGFRRQRIDQQLADAFDPRRVEARDIGLGPVFAHGSTRLNGRTSTRAYTPAAT